VNRNIDDTSENVLSQWPREQDAPAEDPPADEAEANAWGASEPAAAAPYDGAAEPEPELVEDPRIEEHSVEAVAAPQPPVDEALEEELAEVEEAAVEDDEPEYGTENGAGIALAPSLEHAAGELEIPEGYAVLEGVSDGGRRAVGVVVARFNGSVTSRLLERALSELDLAGVRREAITIMVVPGAFELPLAATALAKTRHFACIVALGCVIRGDTPHFEYVASEAASGLQLAALETGVPVSFGVLTLERVEQAETRIEKAAEAVRSALEMADVFSHLRAAAAR
jgi:6,7-dimethyl-8-ribityllumazine synthase